LNLLIAYVQYISPPNLNKINNMQVGRKRGLLIVFEGIDRVGKSTQCEMLTQWFINTKNEPAQKIGFPGNCTFKPQTVRPQAAS
jgi:hypothetical protein